MHTANKSERERAKRIVAPFKMGRISWIIQKCNSMFAEFLSVKRLYEFSISTNSPKRAEIPFSRYLVPPFTVEAFNDFISKKDKRDSFMHKTLHKKIVAHRTEGKKENPFRKKIDQFSNFSLKTFFIALKLHNRKLNSIAYSISSLLQH